MAAEIIWLPEAVEDLNRLRAFIDPHNTEAAGRAAKTILTAANSLQDMPELGAPSSDGYRTLTTPFGRGAYIIRYRYENDRVIIVRVKHSREARL